jgi:CheY-like chemotaxis protein
MREKVVDFNRQIKRGLVVDDEENIRAVMTGFLRTSGYALPAHHRSY